MPADQIGGSAVDWAEKRATRIREHVFPFEDARLREQMGVETAIARILIIERDSRPGHTPVVLVREPIGV